MTPEIIVALIGFLSTTLAGTLGYLQYRAKQSANERLAKWEAKREAERLEAASDQRQDEQVTALIAALHTMAAVSSASIEQSQASTTAIKALTEEIGVLRGCEDETRGIVSELKEDQQTLIEREQRHHQTIIEALGPIQTAVEGIQSTWVRDFQKLGKTLAEMKQQNAEQATQIESAFSEWRASLARIITYLEDARKKGEGMIKPSDNTLPQAEPAS